MSKLFSLLRCAALAALLAAALGSMSGCHIIADAGYRDAKQLAEWPSCFADGVVRDIRAYRR